MNKLDAQLKLSKMIADRERRIQVAKYAHLAETDELKEELKVLEYAYDLVCADRLFN